jgi:hypothetical protein
MTKTGGEMLQELLNRFSTALENRDSTGLASCFTPDGVYDDYFFGPRQGPEGIHDTVEHFYKGGREYRWVFTECAGNDTLAFASYTFSYLSNAPTAGSQRILFDGIARLELRDGLIKRYSEVFDRGMALAQQNFPPDRIVSIVNRYADGLRRSPEWRDHVLQELIP